jgi:dihydrodipicolinate synthase/N-acetylneuraminate lyase
VGTKKEQLVITGVHAAILTHFDDRLAIDHDAVAAEVQRLIAAGVGGIVACGTMGEANSLTAAERRARAGMRRRVGSDRRTCLRIRA